VLGFVAFIIVLGIAFNLAIGYGPVGMVLAVLVAGGMAFGSYLSLIHILRAHET